MFMPLGLGRVASLTEHGEEYVAWGWAVNGFFSVIGSVLTTILSMAVGFRLVQFAALGAYAIAVVAFTRLPAGARAGRLARRDPDSRHPPGVTSGPSINRRYGHLNQRCSHGVPHRGARGSIRTSRARRSDTADQSSRCAYQHIVHGMTDRRGHRRCAVAGFVCNRLQGDVS